MHASSWDKFHFLLELGWLVCDFSPYLSFDVSNKIAVSGWSRLAGDFSCARSFHPAPHELKQVNTKSFAEFLMQALNISKRIPENFSSILLKSSRVNVDVPGEVKIKVQDPSAQLSSHLLRT